MAALAGRRQHASYMGSYLAARPWEGEGGVGLAIGTARLGRRRVKDRKGAGKLAVFS